MVKDGEPFTDGQRPSQRLVGWKRPSQPRAERISLHELHHEVGAAVPFAQIENLTNQRMRDRGRGARLPHEAGSGDGVIGPKQLDGDPPPQPWIVGLIDDAHPAFAKLRDHAVVRNLGGNRHALASSIRDRPAATSVGAMFARPEPSAFSLSAFTVSSTRYLFSGAGDHVAATALLSNSVIDSNTGWLDCADLLAAKISSASKGISMPQRPDRTEAAPYYFTYIDQVPDGDICAQLVVQLPEVLQLARGITETQSLHRYAPGKWSIRDVMNHLADCERLFVARAFWFARGFESPLPSFDQEVAVSAAHADNRPWADIVVEFEAVRGATIAFFPIAAGGWVGAARCRQRQPVHGSGARLHVHRARCSPHRPSYASDTCPRDVISEAVASCNVLHHKYSACSKASHRWDRDHRCARPSYR